MKYGNDTGSALLQSAPDAPLMGQGDGRATMLMSIGAKLRDVYQQETSGNLPDHFQRLLLRLQRLDETGSENRA